MEEGKSISTMRRRAKMREGIKIFHSDGRRVMRKRRKQMRREELRWMRKMDEEEEAQSFFQAKCMEKDGT